MAFGAIAKAVAPALISGAASYLGQRSANKETAASTAAQIAFQERAYSNRYQWQMQDMRKAGLNPILSYSQAPPGGPAGASYVAQNELLGVSDAVNTGVQAYRASNEAQKMDAEIENLKETNKNLVKEGKRIDTDTDKKKSEILLQDNLGARAAQEYRLLREQTTSAKAAAEAAKEEKKFFESEWGKRMRWLDLTGRAINPFASSARDLRAGPRKR